MEPKTNIIYQIKYRGSDLEGIYLGKSKKKILNNNLILLNISPDTERIPNHFPLLGVKSLRVENKEIFYEFSRGIERKLNLTELEQKFLNSLGKKHWGEVL